MYLFMVVLQVCIFSPNDTILAQEDIHLALLSSLFCSGVFMLLWFHMRPEQVALSFKFHFQFSSVDSGRSRA